jgi:hypothetical protein
VTVHYGITGTVKDYFSIGKKGPSIRHGDTIPTSGQWGEGDLYVCRTEPPSLFLKSNGDWHPINKRKVSQSLPGGSESTIAGGAHIIFITAPNGLDEQTVLNLPEGEDGKIIVIKDESSNAALTPIHLVSADLIDGVAEYIIDGEYALIEIMFSGGSWRVVGR